MMNRGGIHAELDYIMSVCKDMSLRLMLAYDVMNALNSGSKKDIDRINKQEFTVEGIATVEDAKRYYNYKRTAVAKVFNALKIGDKASVMNYDFMCRKVFGDVIKDDSDWLEKVKKRE